MVRQYSIDLSTGRTYSTNFVSVTSPTEYDDPVDRSQFRPDSEYVRAFRLSGGGSEGIPKYDSEDSLPSDLEVAIRSGKLDKAEISQIQLQKAEEIKQASDSKKAEISKKKAEKIADARQDYLDKATGFKGSNQSETE